MQLSELNRAFHLEIAFNGQKRTERQQWLALTSELDSLLLEWCRHEVEGSTLAQMRLFRSLPGREDILQAIRTEEIRLKYQESLLKLRGREVVRQARSFFPEAYLQAVELGGGRFLRVTGDMATIQYLQEIKTPASLILCREAMVIPPPVPWITARLWRD